MADLWLDNGLGIGLVHNCFCPMVASVDLPYKLCVGSVRIGDQHHHMGGDVEHKNILMLPSQHAYFSLCQWAENVEVAIVCLCPLIMDLRQFLFC